MDGFPSGQSGQTVNLLATPSKVRILLHPFDALHQMDIGFMHTILLRKTGTVGSVCVVDGN